IREETSPEEDGAFSYGMKVLVLVFSLMQYSESFYQRRRRKRMKKSTLSLFTFVALLGVATGCTSTARTAEGKGGSKGGAGTRSSQGGSGEGGTAQLSAPVGAGPLCTKATNTATFRANCVCHYKPAG